VTDFDLFLALRASEIATRKPRRDTTGFAALLQLQPWFIEETRRLYEEVAGEGDG
jgi:hypothetical protein